ncbi:hypothetical protein VTP01DRAFT_9307 [Rhizomucor pusillus]|uniref:uncharacterized protein n=1 Tax=Rhizomucor pusillus TaxID=4840 RepID=UPI00374372D9
MTGCECSIKLNFKLPCHHNLKQLEDKTDILSLIDRRWLINQSIETDISTTTDTCPIDGSFLSTVMSLEGAFSSRNDTAIFELLPLASAYNRTNGRKSGVHWRPSRIKEHYVSLWMVSKSIYNEVLYNSDWRVGAAPPEKWTLTPHFGPAIANAFQRAVHFLSEAFLFRQEPFQLKIDAPVPPIAESWFKARQSQAVLWKTLLEDRIKQIANFKG